MDLRLKGRIAVVMGGGGAIQIFLHVPMARLGEPQEIVGATLWLVSDWARFVTGAVIPVDGGFTAFAGV